MPMFLPRLAQVLAIFERDKGSPLSESEVLEIRDKAACIMMEQADAEILWEKDPFRDVDPNDCWADWHRVRAEVTGGVLPRVVLCTLGDREFARRAREILQDKKVEHKFSDHNVRMVESFRYGASSIEPAITDTDFAAIEKHETVLYIISEPLQEKTTARITYDTMRLGHALLEAGGVAIKCESSGKAHSRAAWMKLADEARESVLPHGNGSTDFWPALFNAFVQLPIQSEKDYYSCGMHLLGRPDLIISIEDIQKLFPQEQNTAGTTYVLLATFALYLLIECQHGQFRSGNTFSVDAKSPRLRGTWEPCLDYAESDFYYNPFGYWRLSPALP